MINNIEEVLINVFYDDGSLRDIYIKETNITDWDIIWDFIKKLPKVTLKIDGESTNKLSPSVNELFETKYKNSVLLSINYNSIIINCYFFCVEEIEFDISPRDITQSKDVIAVFEFMEKVMKLLIKDVSISTEDEREYPLITLKSSGEFIYNY
jgi:hypothetical protein